MFKEVPVFILCGGLGTRLKEETEFIPKPMVQIGHRPILWHIMRLYSRHGFKRFVLCTGFKSEVIKEYFLNYTSLNSDFTIDLKKSALQVHSVDHDDDWEVTVAYTGEKTQTGARLAIAAKKYLGNAPFAAVTYGDGICDVNLSDVFEFHQLHGKIGTILGVNPPSRFGELMMDGNQVIRFSEKPDFKEKWINGGFFFFKAEFFHQYLNTHVDCILEQAPLRQLAHDQQMHCFHHRGFWACMDTQRDRDYLAKLWDTGEAPWIYTKIKKS